MSDHLIITISRQFGSGGHEIGVKLAAELGIPYYDEQIKEVARENLGMSEYEFQQCEENANRSLLYSIATGVSTIMTEREDKYQRLFDEQRKLILSYAKEGSCIIIGRCGNAILKEYVNCFPVFIRSNKVSRIDRISQRYGVMPSEAKVMIEKRDKERANYYARFAKGSWGDKEFYDLIINSSKFGIDGSVKLIKTMTML